MQEIEKNVFKAALLPSESVKLPELPLKYKMPMPEKVLSPALEKEIVALDCKKSEKNINYTDEEFILVAKVINAEAGADWADDEHQQLVGMVILNRVKSDRFPNTIKDVIYQKGQYSCTWNGAINKKPTEKVIANTKKVLSGEVYCPENVVFQSTFKQGSSVYKKFPCKILKNTTYFCYI